MNKDDLKKLNEEAKKITKDLQPDEIEIIDNINKITYQSFENLIPLALVLRKAIESNDVETRESITILFSNGLSALIISSTKNTDQAHELLNDLYKKIQGDIQAVEDAVIK